MGLWDPEKDILAVFVYNLALVCHRNSKAHRFKGEAYIIPVHICQAGTCGKHHFPINPAREYPQFFPPFLPFWRGKNLNYFARFICGPVKVLFNKFAETKGNFRISPKGLYSEPTCKRPQLLGFHDTVGSFFLCGFP